MSRSRKVWGCLRDYRSRYLGILRQHYRQLALQASKKGGRWANTGDFAAVKGGVTWKGSAKRKAGRGREDEGQKTAGRAAGVSSATVLASATGPLSYRQEVRAAHEIAGPGSRAGGSGASGRSRRPDFDASGLGLGRLRQADLQHTVAITGFDLVRVDFCGQCH